MEKFKICSLRVNDRFIKFNEGINVIVGNNGTGKTILFYLLQYVLGLKTGQILDNTTFNFIELECTFGNKKVIFKRKYPSNTIQLSGDYEIIVNVNDKKIFDIYTELLKPTFENGEDEKAGIEILKMSFISERLSLFNKKNIDIIKKIFGLNVEQLRKYKENIESYKERSLVNSSTYETVKLFITQVENSLQLEDINNKDLCLIKGILNKEYLRIFETDNANKNLINEAINAFQKLNFSIEQRFTEKLNTLESYYFDYKEKFGLNNNKRLADIYKGNSDTSSFGEQMLSQVILLLILSNQNNPIIANPMSILVQDSIVNTFGFIDLKNFRKAIEFECERNGFQYIEFTCFSYNLPPNQVILNLNHEEVFKW